MSDGKNAVLSSELVIDNNRLKEQVYEERKNKTYILTLTLIGSLFVNIILFWVTFFHFPITQQIATTNAAAICKIPSVSEPFIKQEQAANFAIDAVVSLYSYDHVNYLREINFTATRYMTSNFRDQYMIAFGNSATLKSVLENNFVVSATDGGKPAIISAKGIKNGAYTWTVKVPLVVSYSSGRKIESERIIATVDVSREPPSSNNPTGLAVSMINTQHALN